jgi:hypothetical protein
VIKIIKIDIRYAAYHTEYVISITILTCDTYLYTYLETDEIDSPGDAVS